MTKRGVQIHRLRTVAQTGGIRSPVGKEEKLVKIGRKGCQVKDTEISMLTEGQGRGLQQLQGSPVKYGKGRAQR